MQVNRKKDNTSPQATPHGHRARGHITGGSCTVILCTKLGKRPAQKPERALLGKGVSKRASSLLKKLQGCRGNEHTQGRDMASSGGIESFQGVGGNRHTEKDCNSHSSRQRKGGRFLCLLLRGSMAMVVQKSNSRRH